ncbi:hypothetical protein V1511DRAFT_457269 [Dipodascopsis uninucleata]
MLFKGLSALALAAVVNAATNVCSEAERTATTDADLANLSGCTTLSGNLILAETLTSATLTGIEQITGNLICSNNSQITSISAPSLNSIGGTFTLNQLTVLATLSFPVLTSVGAINWITLPGVDSLDFNTGVNKCDSVYISDTSLNSLDGINLTTITTLELNNNLNLDDVEMGVTSVSNMLDISFNGNTAVSFPSLQWANNLTFQDVSSISTPSLNTVNSTYQLINNTFTSLQAPNLTSVGGISVESNNKLTNISFPKLKTVGSAGLEIANNTKLTDLSGFPILSSISGALILDGDFVNASFPELTLVRGAVTIESEDDFDCSEFNDMNSSGSIRGNDYKCEAASTTSTSALTSATGSASSSGSVAATTTTAASTSSSATSTSAASANVVSTSGFAFSAVIAALFFGIF